MTGRRKPGAGSVGLTRSDRGHGRDQEARMLPAASDAMPWWRVLCGALAAVSRRLEGKRARFIVVAFWKTGAPHRMRRPLWGSRGGAGRMTYAEPSAQVRACRSFLHTTARYREIVDDERYREIVGDERYREVVDDVDTYPPYAVDEDAGMAWNEGSAKDAQKTRIRHGIEARKQPLRLS
ncbi:hypothetical protein ST47_g6843 [Ascochyta rabiei]|uniref:Uncharacterized protein n=1 Tax=Didymella rabiei TaxID=5454 RepID=A0A163BUX7_DIDRA|nr:hypothetical protein ST47_g6843 [Ascochyta rabiei]